jgi:hypothetical protein
MERSCSDCCLRLMPIAYKEDFTILSFARFRCAIRDLALVAIFSAATSAFLIVCSILSGAIPRRIRLSIIFFLRSDLAAFLICLTSANISFGIFVIPLHYRVFIHGANLMACLAPSHRDQARSPIRRSHRSLDNAQDQRSAIKICDINEYEQARALISCGRISVGQLRGSES